MAKSRGLGRGLAALVAEFPAGQISMVEIELSQVRPSPRQPRRSFDEESIGQLAESIKSDGIVQQIVVLDSGDGYEIVAGERRWRAAKLAGLRTIPAIVRPVDEREALILALAENVAREDLNAVEEARAYAALSDELALNQTEIAKRVGKSRPAVANTMRLLDLPDAVLDLSLYRHLGQPMAGVFEPVGIVASAVLMVGGLLVGAWGLRRRDLDR